MTPNFIFNICGLLTFSIVIIAAIVYEACIDTRNTYIRKNITYVDSAYYNFEVYYKGYKAIVRV